MKSQVIEKSLVITPQTDLVASNIEEVRAYILEKLKEYRDTESIVLDAGGIETVDSLGVNLIIGLYKQANSENKHFEVAGAGVKFQKIADFFRFNDLFKVKFAN